MKLHDYVNEAMILNEMAMNRNDAVKLCVDLGNEFIDHFHKVMREGKLAQDFEHHCKEMDTWWRKVRDIKLKQNNKIISTNHLIDWFFTAGSDVEIKIEESYQDVYEHLYINLLQDRMNSDVLTILNELLD